MTRLEYMRDVGQATLGLALQTLFWAALKGGEEIMARTIEWNESVRPDAQALVERLPKELQARFSTPEKLLTLFVLKSALDVSAIYIVRADFRDATHAFLIVKGITGVDQPLPMRLGPTGWKLVAGQEQLSYLKRELGGKAL